MTDSEMVFSAGAARPGGSAVGLAPAGARAVTGRVKWTFLVAIPAVIALYAALNNWAVLQVAGYPDTLLFYTGHAFVPWWTSALATWGLGRWLQRWRPPVLPVLAAGCFVACLLVLPYSRWLTAQFGAGWLGAGIDGVTASQHIHSELGSLSLALRAGVVWIVVNLLFERLTGFSLYRRPAAAGTGLLPVVPPADEGRVAGTPAAASAAPPPQLLQRLPGVAAGSEIIAIKAEQHYVKVHAAGRSFMVLYRFSDAVAGMDPAEGMQVHRSWWVRSAAIAAVHRTPGQLAVELANGLVVPVSAPNRGLVREWARSRNIPVLRGH